VEKSIDQEGRLRVGEGTILFLRTALNKKDIEAAKKYIGAAGYKQQAGCTIALVERLGPEYLATNGLPSGHPALCWYDDLLEALDTRVDWPGHGLRAEIEALRGQLAEALERHG
jgi:hypothetical protein